MVDLAKHQRTDLVACLRKSLCGHLTHRIGAIVQIGEKPIEFGLDRGLDPGEQEAEDGRQRQGALAGEGFWIEPGGFQELLGEQILRELNKYFRIFRPSCIYPL